MTSAKTGFMIAAGLFAAVVIVHAMSSVQPEVPRAPVTATPAPVATFTDRDKQRARTMILGNGYDCKDVTDMRGMIIGDGYVARCESAKRPGHIYWFDIYANGGKGWLVEPK